MGTPTSQESLEDLRQLQGKVAGRGDHTLAVLLSGVELYVRMGRDLELLDFLRSHVEQMREAVENTPSATELKQLYERP